MQIAGYGADVVGPAFPPFDRYREALQAATETQFPPTDAQKKDLECYRHEVWLLFTFYYYTPLRRPTVKWIPKPNLSYTAMRPLSFPLDTNEPSAKRQKTSDCALLSLPRDILLELLDHLSHTALAQVSLTNRYLYSLCVAIEIRRNTLFEAMWAENQLPTLHSFWHRLQQCRICPRPYEMVRAFFRSSQHQVHVRTALINNHLLKDLPVISIILEETDIDLNYALRSSSGRMGMQELHHTVTPLLCAVNAKNSALVDLLLRHGAEPKFSPDGMSPMTYASHVYFSEEIVRLLHAAGAPIGEEGLIHAITYHLETPELFALFLDMGLDPNIRIKQGNTLLCLMCNCSVAERKNRTAIVKLLLSAGANPNLPGVFGSTPLYEAVACGNVDCVRLLLAAGANPNIATDIKKTPAMIAVQCKRLSALRELLKVPKRGKPYIPVDLDLCDCDGKTALTLAREGGCYKIINALLAEISSSTNE